MISLDTVVTRLEYPNTSFEVIQLVEDHDQVVLVVSQSSEDNFNAGTQFEVRRAQVVDAYYEDEHSAACAVRKVLHYISAHEVDEALLCDGRRVFDPHSTWKRSARP